MEKIPADWIDKLFNCMTEFYGERWTNQFSGDLAMDLSKKTWQSALTGLSYEDIKDTLLYYKWIARKYSAELPPHQMEFFRSAKIRNKSFVEPKQERGCAAIARSHLDAIKAKLRGSVLHGTMVTNEKISV